MHFISWISVWFFSGSFHLSAEITHLISHDIRISTRALKIFTDILDSLSDCHNDFVLFESVSVSELISEILGYFWLSLFLFVLFTPHHLVWNNWYFIEGKKFKNTVFMPENQHVFSLATSFTCGIKSPQSGAMWFGSSLVHQTSSHLWLRVFEVWACQWDRFSYCHLLLSARSSLCTAHQRGWLFTPTPFSYCGLPLILAGCLVAWGGSCRTSVLCCSD